MGSSAGGLDALGDFLRYVPAGLSCCYVVAQHLSPTRDSPLPRLLARETTLKVQFAQDRMRLAPGLVLVAPPNVDITVGARDVRLSPPGTAPAPHPDIDVLLRSAAESWGARTAAVVLSGTGHDGSAGVLAIRAAGGTCIAQEPDGAGFAGMPESAAATGAVHLVLTADQIGPALRRLVEQANAVGTRAPDTEPRPAPAAVGSSKAPTDGDPTAQIVTALLKATGMDFTGFKEATVRRQIDRRMGALGVTDLDRYRAVVADSVPEARNLSSALLVTVTSFFRDPTAWRALEAPARELIGGVDSKVAGQVRVWIPGCATGQEAYTLGMIIATLLGDPGDLSSRLKVFATDMDERALQVARRGLYSDEAVRSVPREYRDRWLRRHREGWEITSALRDCVVLAQHNVAMDPPLSRIHIVSLRNTLIYFQPRKQERVLRLLHFSLVPGGLLLLGESERIADPHELFATQCAPHRIYSRRATGSFSTLPVPQPRPAEIVARRPRAAASAALDLRAVLRGGLLRGFTPPYLILDDQDEVVEVVGEVSRWCWVAEGQRSSHIVAMVSKELQPAVRSLVLQVRHGAMPRAERSITTGSGTVDVVVSRLDETADADEAGHGTIVVSFAAAEPVPVRRESSIPGTEEASTVDTDHTSDSTVARLAAELASTEAVLQTTIEQLSTSNEELQALNEELHASTEELQASNEEVQASNEELEATNEELSSLNSELQQRGTDLATANSDLENIQASLTCGLVLVDRDLHVMRFTPLAVRLFALIDTDMGRPLTSIPSTMEIPDLELRLRATIDDGQHDLVELRGDRSDMLLHFHPYRRADGTIRGAVVVSTDISEVATAHRSAQRNLRDLVAVTEAVREAVWQRSEDGRLLFLNSQVERLFGLNRRRLLQDPDLMFAAIHPDDREQVALISAASSIEPYELKYRIAGPRGRVRWVRESAVAVPADETGPGYVVASAIDVSDQHDTERPIRDRLATLERLFDNTVFGVVILDADDRIVGVNDCFARMAGYERDALVGLPVHLLAHDDAPDTPEDPDSALRAEAPFALGIAHRRLAARDGTPYLVTVETRPVDAVAGAARIMIVHDVTQLHETHRELAVQAQFDQHTGLLVRSHFRELLGKELARADRSGVGLAVLWIDLDRFKEVNDRYGHQAGDIALREVALRLQRVARRQDAVGRLGGDELAVLVTAVDRMDSLESVTQRILAVLRKPIALHDSQIYLSGSIGVAVAPEDGDEPDILLHSADTAMYSAKKAGRDRRVYFRAEMNQAAEDRAGIRHDLAAALRGRHFVMHYQPIIDIASGSVGSVEALIRWTRDGTVVAAGDFMDIAEQTGQLRAVGGIALELIDADLGVLQAELGPDRVAVSINLSPTQLEERDLLDWLLGWEPAGGFEQLIVEVTEAAALARGSRAVETLALLRKLGVRLSIDDFGTGYSNLELLDRLRPGIIKIDRSLLIRADDQPRGRAVLQAAVQLAHALEADVVIEGVQNEKLWQLAQSLGVEHAQGFHLARPMPLVELIEWLRQRQPGPPAD